MRRSSRHQWLMVAVAASAVLAAQVSPSAASRRPRRVTRVARASAVRHDPRAGAERSTPPDPLRTAAARASLRGRLGQVSAAVLDLDDDREWLLHPSERAQTASIIKVDILETLLYESERRGVPLSELERDEAAQMIEQSDDDDATELWGAIGGAAGIAAFNERAGLTETRPNTAGYWGETTTSAADQIKLLRQLAEPSRLLTAAARRYELGLMRDVDADQAWGVSGGVPAGVSIALKNGWVPLASATDWEINSIGWIDGRGRDYLVAVLTAHDPSEGYGIATIERLSAAIDASLGERGAGLR